jgi:hypothetical protein
VSKTVSALNLKLLTRQFLRCTGCRVKTNEKDINKPELFNVEVPCIISWHALFLRWRIISPITTLKLKNHPLSAVRDCLFSIFSAIRGRGSEGIFSVCHRIQTGSGSHPASYPVGIGSCFPEVKRPGREADHSLPSSVNVTVWSYTSTPLFLFMVWCLIKQCIRLHARYLVKHRDNFTLYPPFLEAVCYIRNPRTRGVRNPINMEGGTGRRLEKTT